MGPYYGLLDPGSAERGCYGVYTFLWGNMKPNFRKNQSVKNDVSGNLLEYRGGGGTTNIIKNFLQNVKIHVGAKSKLRNYTSQGFSFLITYK